jgi:hypothetical protein
MPKRDAMSEIRFLSPTARSISGGETGTAVRRRHPGIHGLSHTAFAQALDEAGETAVLGIAYSCKQHLYEGSGIRSQPPFLSQGRDNFFKHGGFSFQSVEKYLGVTVA